MISLIHLIVWLLSIQSQESKLLVTIEGCKNGNGNIKYSLYNKKEGFPSDLKTAIRVGTAEIKNKSAIIEISGLAGGYYALSILHDENGNGNMDFNLFHMPKEGFGASNNATRTFGPPTFDDAKFLYKSDGSLIKITMVYW